MTSVALTGNALKDFCGEICGEAVDPTKPHRPWVFGPDTRVARVRGHRLHENVLVKPRLRGTRCWGGSRRCRERSERKRREPPQHRRVVSPLIRFSYPSIL